jgi:NitT/TauT family transport system substrate-binding protein
LRRPGAGFSRFFIALHQGLFKAQGLTVNFVPATSSETAIARQVAGQYDITAGNYVSYIQAQQAGEANLDIFAEGSVMEAGAQTLFTMPDSPVKTLAELKGKTVAINAPNILYLLAASVLAEHGIAPKEVKFVSSPEPFASMAEQQDGASPLADLNQGATTSFPVEGYVVTKQRAQKYPHTLARTTTAPRSRTRWKPCPRRWRCPRTPPGLCRLTSIRSARAGWVTWTRSACSGWSMSCSSSSDSIRHSRSARC